MRLPEAGFLYCPTEHLDALDSLRFDLAINIASLQEMNAFSVARYFAFLRAHVQDSNFFYCCNREEKLMAGGELSRMRDYPWEAGDRHTIDEPCPFYRIGITTKSWWKTRRGPSILSVRVPFLVYFDPILHRLTCLQTHR